MAARATKKPRAANVYKPKKAVPEEWTSRHAAVKALGKGGTIPDVAKRMKIKETTAKNLIRWLSSNGYVART